MIWESYPDNDYSDGSTLQIRTWNGPSLVPAHSFFKFDLSAIPDGYYVTSAILYLYCSYPGTDYVNSISMFHAEDSWTTPGLTWNSAPTDLKTPMPGSLLDNVPGHPIYQTWSAYDLLDTGNWNYSADLFDNTLSLVLASGNEAAGGLTSFSTTTWNGQAPRLEITVSSVPEPSVGLLLALAGMGVLTMVITRRNEPGQKV